MHDSWNDHISILWTLIWNKEYTEIKAQNLEKSNPCHILCNPFTHRYQDIILHGLVSSLSCQKKAGHKINTFKNCITDLRNPSILNWAWEDRLKLLKLTARNNIWSSKFSTGNSVFLLEIQFFYWK